MVEDRGADVGGVDGEQPLVVAVTGPTGTFGEALLPLLDADPRVGRVVGIARRPFDPQERGFTDMEYRRGDVRDPEALRDAFRGADVVVHLAFLITGAAAPDTIREINIGGTVNAFRAAVEVGARRFVYASSVAAYGFHDDNPEPITEEWPVRPADHLFYAQEKAELEAVLADEAEGRDIEVYLLRPPIVLGPHVVGAKGTLPAPLTSLLGRAAELVMNAPVPVPVVVPPVRIQFIHEDDVADALLRCITGVGPPGAYNITGDGVLTAPQVARELGLLPLSMPGGVSRRVARGVASLPAVPFAPLVAGWAEALSNPPVMDASRAKELLGWAPQHSSLDALRATIAHARRHRERGE